MANAGSWMTRPATPADLPALTAIIKVVVTAGELPGREPSDIAALPRTLAAEPSGTVVGLADGEIVGFVTPHGSDLMVARDQRRRGHGTRLVAAGLAWARAPGEPRLELAPPPGSEPAAAFLRTLGFAFRASLWLPRLPAGTTLPPPDFPPAVVSRPLVPGADDPAYVALMNAAFAEHPSPLSFSVDAIRHHHAQPDFDPTDILLVSPTDAPADLIAFCRAVPDRDDPSTGIVALIGVRADWRGRGLGRALLRWGVGHLRDRGAATVSLLVDADNEHALALYERTGFVRIQEWPRWAKAT